MGNQNGSAKQQSKVTRASRPRGLALGVMVCLGQAVGFAEPVVGEPESDKASSALIGAVTDVSPNYLFVDATGQRGASTGLSLSTEFTSRWEIIGPQGVLETVGAGTGIPFGEGLFVQLPIPSQSTILTIFSDPVMVSPLPIMSYERAARLPYRTTIPVDGEAAGLVGVEEGDGGEGSAILARFSLASSQQRPGIGLQSGGNLIGKFATRYEVFVRCQTLDENTLFPAEHVHAFPIDPAIATSFTALWGPYPNVNSRREVLFSQTEAPIGDVLFTVGSGAYSSAAIPITVKSKVNSIIYPVTVTPETTDMLSVISGLGESFHPAPRWVLQRAISAHRAGEVTLASHLYDQCDLNGDKLVDAADELLLLGTPEVTGWEFR